MQVNKPTIILMICYARSGGTLLNRCIGSLPNTVIISEVNPLGEGSGKKQGMNTKKQAKEWYDISINSDTFTDSIKELNKICIKKDKKLIIRDWSFVNFNPDPKNNFNPPNKLLSYKNLNKNFNLITFAFIRDGIDVYLSRQGDINIFAKSYKHYLNEIIKHKIKIFKYEDFCINPEKTMNAICEYAGIKYNESFKKYNSFNKVNGDIQIKGGSRGVKLRNITLLPRKNENKATIKLIDENKTLQECNRLMNYPTKYNSRKINKSLKSKIKLIKKAYLNKVTKTRTKSRV